MIFFNFATVKKWIALILFAIYAISSTELREIAKLPVLIQHYNEHRQLNHSITFSQYLVDHYNNLPHTDNDQERDNQLPFKQVDSTVMSSPAIPPSSAINLKRPVMSVVKDVLFPRNDQFIPSGNFSKIWQPPRSGSSIIA